MENDIEKMLKVVAEDVRKLKRAENEIQLNSRELIWANVFHDTINESTWLEKKNFSLGRAAIGYNFAYVLYRILDEIKPENVLEIGLGQSTHMVVQYMKNSSNARKHIVVEQEPSWVEFWKNNHEVPEKSKICYLPVQEVEYKECNNVLVYEDFEQLGENQKWNLILVDGPARSKCDVYARIDLLKILPHSLSDKWIIMFDDMDRERCANAAKEIVDLLQEKNVEYCEGYYKGKKNVYVLCSTDLQYVTTM